MEKIDYKLKFSQTPKYTAEWYKLRIFSMTVAEREQFRSECKTIGGLAKLFGYSEREIRRIIKDLHIYNVARQPDDPERHKKGQGQPRLLYHPDDIRPFISDQFTRKVINMVTNNKEAFQRVCKENPAILNLIRQAIIEVENE